MWPKTVNHCGLVYKICRMSQNIIMVFLGHNRLDVCEVAENQQSLWLGLRYCLYIPRVHPTVGSIVRGCATGMCYGYVLRVCATGM